MTKEPVFDLVECIKFYSELYHETEAAPCTDLLHRHGARDVTTAAKLLRESIDKGDFLTACFCVDLLAKANMPGCTEVLTKVVADAIAGGVLPDEVLEELFDDAIENDRFLRDPRFLSIARNLIGLWNNTHLDHFILAAANPTDAQ